MRALLIILLGFLSSGFKGDPTFITPLTLFARIESRHDDSILVSIILTNTSTKAISYTLLGNSLSNSCSTNNNQWRIVSNKYACFSISQEIRKLLPLQSQTQIIQIVNTSQFHPKNNCSVRIKIELDSDQGKKQLAANKLAAWSNSLNF
jgi:hypothetical protein